MGLGLWNREDASGVPCLFDNLERDGVEQYVPVTTIVTEGWRFMQCRDMERIEPVSRNFIYFV